MKLLDREVVDSDEPHAKRNEVFRTIRREVCVVGMEVALANEARVSSLQQYALVSGDRLAPQIRLGHRHAVVVEFENDRAADECVERQLIDTNTIGYHVARRIDVRSRV